MDAVTAEQLDGMRGRLRSFCYQMLGSPFDAEDAVQDVLERAWRARGRYDEARSSLATWCFRIARNVCIDRLRETGRRPLPWDLRTRGRRRRPFGPGAGRAVADAGAGRLVRRLARRGGRGALR